MVDAIRTAGLENRFGQTRAVGGLDLSVAEGKVHGLRRCGCAVLRRRRGRAVHAPTRHDPVVPDIDVRRFDAERRERGADLAPMVGPVVQGLCEPDANRGVGL